MDTENTEQSAEDSMNVMFRLIETTGLAYVHSSGCAVLKDGTWLQPEQWSQWLAHLMEVEESEC